ncbi:MAG: alanine:cation symporter family protein, partial [Planctomycetes bacterium]|nr:alanine:cation symporter family protein [Planctomycetota bacterium]
FAIRFQPADARSPSFATPMAYLERCLTGSWRFVIPLVAGLLLIHGVVLANLVQSNSLAQAVHNRFGVPDFLIALVVTACVSLLIFGGMRRIVDVISLIAPWIILLYVGSGLVVLILHPLDTLASLALVFQCAFTPHAVAGGVMGYGVLQAMQFGVSRGIFSHMSGLGTGAFFQSANEEEPAKGAFMAAMTPFVDTMIVCSVTGLVILASPYWMDLTGAHLTLASFSYGLGPMGEGVVMLSLVVFAFTTIVAFAHVSERCFKYLGGNNVFAYRVFFVSVTFLGPFLNLGFVWSLSDIIIAALILAHTLPLLNVTVTNLRSLNRDLESYCKDD